MAGLGNSNSTVGLLPLNASSHQLRQHTASDSFNSLGTNASSVGDKFSLAAAPNSWGTHLSPHYREADDALHNPTAKDYKNGKFVDRIGGFSPFTMRGLMNLGCLAIVVGGLLALFIGYPIITHVQQMNANKDTGPPLPPPSALSFGRWDGIDQDTPKELHTKKDWKDGKDWQLVFSDEFNVDGRSFYPGDDPYWEAVDLWYWGTNNLEWYDPGQITTEGGDLVITLKRTQSHKKDFLGGMMSTWNKFCYSGGLVEVAVTLPGSSSVQGLWPAVWTMGNLGRAGYGATLDGTWPYTYDTCDVGTAPNQTINSLPAAALVGGWEETDGHLSYLPGQRLSRCSCPGSDHPGPMHSDGTYVGRAAPEIDFFEAQVEEGIGAVSQSLQMAPFNHDYLWKNTSDTFDMPDASVSHLNSYKGASTQQAASVVSNTNTDCYELGTGCKAVYGAQFKGGSEDGYITWLNDDKIAWTIKSSGTGPDELTEIGQRPIPQEPMYLLANLGISEAFGKVEYDKLVFPTKMRIDYIRVYQDPDNINIGCDPVDFPTASYIESNKEAYCNANLTTYTGSNLTGGFEHTFPKNSLVDGCDGEQQTRRETEPALHRLPGADPCYHQDELY